MPDDMVERVARALCHANGVDPDRKYEGLDGEIHTNWVIHAPQARAAIAAMREPTEAMKVAALNATFDEKKGDRVYVGDVPIIWQAMIDAALKETVDSSQ